MKIAVYCGAHFGHLAAYNEQAYQIGQSLANQGHELVYGGGATGLMGAVADGCLDAGGKVYGIMPHFLIERELAHPKLTEFTAVSNMQSRKAKMLELADACLALPGGLGTLEEISEVLSWLRVGASPKPCAFYNQMDFYRPLRKFFSHMVEEGFLEEAFADQIKFSDDLAEILNYFTNFDINILSQEIIWPKGERKQI